LHRPKYLNTKYLDGIICFLSIALSIGLSIVSPVVIRSSDLSLQNTNTSHSKKPEKSASVATEERIKSLIVMITCRLGDKENFGAGIIFGYTASRIYIATANHVVRQGIDEAKNVRVQFKWLPGESIEAKLLGNADSNLDLAVLVVTGRVEIDLKSLPFDQLGDSTSVKRGDLVHSIGNPRGQQWRVNVTPDRVSDIVGDTISFESGFIGPGHSGGGLLNERWELVAMIKADEPPDGVAVNIRSMLNTLQRWDYPVKLTRSKADIQSNVGSSDPVASEIGQKKSNGFYEVTLENVTISNSSGQQPCPFSVQPNERAIIVRFTIGALNNSVSAYTRKEGDTDFLILDRQGKRFERDCGNGWYGWGTRTITLVYLIPKEIEDLRFRFHDARYGRPIIFSFPAGQ
jgi:hypothetical protein